MKTSTRLMVSLGMVFVLAGLLIVGVVHFQMRQQAVLEAGSKARIILDRDLATHNYFNQELKPAVLAWSTPFRAQDYFDPAWMSSTYALRHIDQRFADLTLGTYYNKACALNARNPENEADPYERAFLDELNTNPQLVDRSAVRFFDDKPYLVVLRRGLVMEEACLRCHGDPRQAPGDLVRNYGGNRGFQRELGEVVSAISLRIPLAEAYRQTERFSLKLIGLLLAVLFCLFVIQHWLNRRLVFGPLSSMQSKVLQIAASDEHLGEEVAAPRGSDLKELTDAFNAMSASLKERGAELKYLNRQMLVDIAARARAEQELQQAKERLEYILENSPDAIGIVDDHGCFVKWNRMAAELYGYTFEELKGKSAFELYADQGELESMLTELHRKGYVKKYEINMKRKDGSVGLFEISISLLRDGSNSVLGSVCGVRDLSDVKLTLARLKLSNAQLQQEITERQRAEQALRESEMRYRDLVETMNEFVAELDVNGQFLFVNRPFVDFTGYSMGELLGSNFFSYLHPDDVIGAQTQGRDLQVTLKPIRNCEYRFRLKDGTYRTLLSNGDPRYDARGRLASILQVSFDITERKDAEETIQRAYQTQTILNDLLRFSLQRIPLEKMLEHAMDLIIAAPWLSLERKGSIFLMEDGVLVMKAQRGLPAAVLETCATLPPGKCMWGRAAAADTMQCASCVDECQEFRHQGMTLHGHCCAPIRSDNRVLGLINFHLKPGHQRNDKELEFLQSVANVLVGIIERKRNEQERVLLQTAVEQVAESIVITARDGTIQYVNPAFQRITGYHRDEVVGNNPRILSSGLHDQAFYRELWAVITSGKVWMGHLVNRRSDGSLFEEEASISPIRDRTGEIASFVAVKRDVTEEIKREKQLRQAQKMEAIGTLAGGIAHDFNNILAAIIGYTEITMFNVDKGSRPHENLQEVLRAGYRAKDLVKQILAFSRQTEQELRPMQLGPIVKEALKLLRASLPATVEIQQNIAGDLNTVLADPTQIHQVLMNLCTNAAHAMQERGGGLKLSLSNVELNAAVSVLGPQMPPGPYVLLSVRDTGHGMRQDTMEKIFDPYFTTKQKGEGTGLGLAVVHGIVKDHGGTVTVESKLGEGTTFHIYIPAIKSLAVEERVLEENHPGGSERVLLVDDEQDIVNVGKQILERLGYEVVASTSSVEALEIFRSAQQPFDLVITDLTMPGMTGLELARQVLDSRPAVPIILCTGYTNHGIEDKAKELGIGKIFLKPIIIQELSIAIREVMTKQPG